MLTKEDIAYIRAGYDPLEELCRQRGVEPAEVRAAMTNGLLPQPSYRLEDGTEMVPRDYFDLVDEAGGVDGLREHFLGRYKQAANAWLADEADAEWEAYLSGEYGVCLREVTPETIVRKSMLVARIEALLASPAPEDVRWGSELRDTVDRLDELERPFAPQYDRLRFGGPSSRERLIDGARELYPQVFARQAAVS